MIKKHFGKPAERGYDIFIGQNLLGDTASLFGLYKGSRALIVTDDGVPQKYSDRVYESLNAAGCLVYNVTIPGGEEHKNLNNVGLILDAVLLNNFNRSDIVISVGGGVVGDTAGFAASCFMRGIDFYNVPTTLLSQADSSVGGKTGVNFSGVKNLIGAFHRPKGVLIDTETLSTLSGRHFSNGMAEIIKMASTFDCSLFDDIGRHIPIDQVISRVLDIKISVVESDEKESGLRRSLNFGHTLGHGIEMHTGLLHGESIGVGMLAMSGGEAKDKIAGKLTEFGLPISVDVDVDAVIETVMHDKKSSSGGVRCILCDKIGTYYEAVLSREQIKERLMSVTG